VGSDRRAVVGDVLDRPTMRSLVVEVNDGIVAIAGVVEGFAGAGLTGSTLVLAAVCSVVAGAIALGGARYAEEAVERDARLNVIAEERRQLELSPEQELAELATLYEAKGLTRDLAESVALQLSALDPLAAHVEAEHNLSVRDVEDAPRIIAVAAGLAFALGSMVPLLAVLLTPDAWRAAVTFVTVLASLVVTSVFLARVGGTRVRSVLARTLLTATAAMSLSLLVGSLFHP
jgi:VIT1/CCC1 family predicted Fe2+/Mn2+ transporter